MKKTSSPRYKGKVTVGVSNGCLRLSLPRSLFNGKQKYLYLGLRNTPENRKIAEAKTQMIESDIIYERFDYTLKKYRQKAPPPPKEVKRLTLAKLFEDYIHTLKNLVRPGTWNNGYLVMWRHIKRSPFCHAEVSTVIGQDVFDWAIQNLTADTTSRLMTQLNACYKWAIDKKLVDGPSPFAGLSAKAKKLNKLNEDNDINPFSKDERDRIIQLFCSDPRFSHYAPFVRFCFYTGCRPSEAIALRWSDVDPSLTRLTFSSAILIAQGGRKRCKGLKTEPRREFPCNGQVQKILGEARSRWGSEIVFPSVTGQPINTSNFRKRQWKAVLEILGIEYRKPYQMRHTFITLCLDAGVNPKDLAARVGNSPEIIYRHYAGRQRDLSIPEL